MSFQQKPSVGRIVHVLTAGARGPIDAAAAFVTHVHEDGKINVTVFLDGGEIEHRGGVTLIEDMDEVQNCADINIGSDIAFWPPRV